MRNVLWECIYRQLESHLMLVKRKESNSEPCSTNGVLLKIQCDPMFYSSELCCSVTGCLQFVYRVAFTVCWHVLQCVRVANRCATPCACAMDCVQQVTEASLHQVCSVCSVLLCVRNHNWCRCLCIGSGLWVLSNLRQVWSSGSIWGGFGQ